MICLVHNVRCKIHGMNKEMYIAMESRKKGVIMFCFFCVCVYMCACICMNVCSSYKLLLANEKHAFVINLVVHIFCEENVSLNIHDAMEAECSGNRKQVLLGLISLRAFLFIGNGEKRRVR